MNICSSPEGMLSVIFEGMEFKRKYSKESAEKLNVSFVELLEKYSEEPRKNYLRMFKEESLYRIKV